MSLMAGSRPIKSPAIVIAPGTSGLFPFDEGTKFQVTINAQGLRADQPVGPPAAGETRLLCLGDSFTFGYGVAADQAWPYLLNSNESAPSDRVESLNAGVSGYGPNNEAAWLQEYGWT